MTSRHKLSDILPIAAIGLICVLAPIEVLLLLVDRQLTKGVTYKDVDLAAWVQAVGSILAIMASVALVWWSNKAERSRLQAQANEKARRFLTAVHVLIEQLRDEAFSIGMFRASDLMTESAETRRMQKTRLQQHVERLQQVPVYELPSAHAIGQTIDALRMGLVAIVRVDDPQGSWGEDEFGERKCGKDYGSHWLSIYAYLKDYAYYLKWEIDQIDDPGLLHPSESR